MRFDERAASGASGEVRRFRVAEEDHDPSAAALVVARGGEVRVYARRLRVFHAALVLVLSGLLSVGAFGGAADDGGGLVGAGVAVVVAGSLFAAAIMRRGIVVSPGQVAIRGLLTTRHLSPSEVERFEPPPAYGKVFGRVGLRVVLRGGRVLTSAAFTNTPLDGGATVGRRECDELNRWLALQTGTSPDAVEPLLDPPPGARARRVVDRIVVVLAFAVAVFCLIGVVVG